MKDDGQLDRRSSSPAVGGGGYGLLVSLTLKQFCVAGARDIQLVIGQGYAYRSSTQHQNRPNVCISVSGFTQSSVHLQERTRPH